MVSFCSLWWQLLRSTLLTAFKYTIVSEVKWKPLSHVRLFVTPIDHTVHGIRQARILEWVAFPFSRESSQPKDWTHISSIEVDSLPAEIQGKPKNTGVGSLSLLQWIFQTQESNQGLLHWRRILYQLSYEGNPQMHNIVLFLELSAYILHPQYLFAL